jgi:hypothetical protein
MPILAMPRLKHLSATVRRRKLKLMPCVEILDFAKDKLPMGNSQGRHFDPN